MSLLDSNELHLATHIEPSVAIGTDKEYGNLPVLTTTLEQQTLPQSLFTLLPLKRKILYVSEKVKIKKEPKREWYNVFVLETAALSDSKNQKLIHEASTNLNPIHSNEPNTPTPIELSKDELTVIKGGDTYSNQPPITLSNVSTSPGFSTLDPVRDIHRSDLSGEARQLSGNRSTDELERVFHTPHPLQGSEGNVGSPLPHLTLLTSPLMEGTFPAPNLEVSPTQCEGGRQLLGKSSSNEPSRIFYAGTSLTSAGVSVSETQTRTIECSSITSQP